MTDLKKPIRRKTNVTCAQSRPLVITLYPEGTIGFREAGRRKEFLLPIQAAYVMAVRAEVESRRRERRRQKKLGA